MDTLLQHHPRMPATFDTLIIGAGAAGLAAARRLREAGQTTLILEARDRIGGRVLTTVDPHTALAIELGAEFVHGEAPRTMRLADAAGLVTVPVLGAHYRADRNNIEPLGDMFKRIGRVFRKMKDDREPDRSFQEFLDEKPGGRKLAMERELARGFAQGFFAADTARISEKSLAGGDEHHAVMVERTSTRSRDHPGLDARTGVEVEDLVVEDRSDLPIPEQ